MRVALVTEWLDAWRGGAETSTRQFMHHLMGAGVDLHVFTRSRPSPAPGLSVHTLNGAAMSRTRRSVTFALRVEKMLRNEPFDIVHAISPCRHADIYQPRGGTAAETVERNLALRRSAPGRHLKRVANRFNFKQRYMLGLERKLLGPGDRPIVVAISQYVVRQLKEHYALPDERIRLIYNGVDPDPTPADRRAANRRAIRGEFGIGDDQMLVLLVAHNFRLKGVERWMDALALLLRRGRNDIRSLVIGRGDSRRWHQRAERLGIARVLTFVGPSDRVREFHHAADLLVHPTYYDPCSRVVLEGLAAGLPCITTRWDGASEMIVDGNNGFVLSDPDHVPAIADLVDRLRDGVLRRTMSESARTVRDHISMARHSTEMLKLYEEVARSKEHRV
ncbi:MAG: glycosyltransferase family 4 protein [Phycisphaerales bacterium]|nr:glycosyltransferase family 4 protein [Phycisphaerales bacterium]